jgi:hypothetical protein
MTNIVGSPPNTEEAYWIGAAKLMTPDKLDAAVERLDAHAKYLFSTVSIVGTLLTGFSIFSPTGASILRNKLIFVPVGLACLSLALAMIGLTPWVRKICLSEPMSVRDYYDHVIRRRGIYISMGSTFFALSLLSIIFVTPYSTKPTPLTPLISVRLTGTDDKTILSSKVELQDLPRSGMAETEIAGYRDTTKGTQQSILFKDVTFADNSNKITVSAELDHVQKYSRFVITSRVKSGTSILCEKKVDVYR